MFLSDYQLKEQLYQSTNSIVYRAVRADDEQSVILKMLSEQYPSPERIAWFKREYDVTRNLKLAGVVDVYDLRQQPRFFMVMEDFGGESLKRLGVLGCSQLLELGNFLQLAIHVTDILEQVHARHIMHKDINPANIVLNPETGQVKLIDFGISTVLERENQSFRNPNQLEGTLAYISPEQTGRMNRAIDYRTDFYSLGVTFYELLTGQLPFDYDDSLVLVHAHMARQPIAPHQINPKVPIILSEIVLKLMAKNAEDRYQSAYGLKYDLEQLASQSRHSKFDLGSRDISTRFQLPQKLYGRGEQINALLAGFERVSDGNKELMLVEGYAGVGKSALINEVHKPITAKQGYFIRGKFDQLQRGTPYTAFTQAFNEFCDYLLTENEFQLEAWKSRILSAVGNNGQVLIDIIPNLQQVIGPQPAVSSVPPQQAQNRFNLYFQFFIRALCRPEHPLVIFIDDWQWADQASLNLLQLLMSDAMNQYLFVIAAYRDNEVDQAHPFRFTLNSLEQTQATINTIHLDNLSQTDLTALLEDTFGQNSSTVSNATDSVAALATLIHHKTAGNAFFTMQLLQTLHFDGLLNFNMLKRAWEWDMKQISQQALSNNVVELMSRQLIKLPLSTKKLLQLAACIGNRFDLQTLATIYEQSHLTTAADLAITLQKGLILPLSDEYKLVAHQAGSNVSYRFVHDRVHQAAYLLISEEQKQAVHLKIARLLLAPVASEMGLHTKEGIGELDQAPSDALQAQLFEITNHYNVGMRGIETKSEKVALARLNLLAGQKAMSGMASQAALDYFQIGIQLLGQEAWSTFYDLALLLHNKAAEAAYLCRHFTQMDVFIEQVLQYAHTPLEQMEVHQTKLFAYLSQQNLPAALQSGLVALQQLGHQLPTDPTAEDVRLALQATQQHLQGKSITDLRHLPQMTVPEQMAALQMFWALSIPAFIAHRHLFVMIILKMVELNVRYGNSHLSSHIYINYGMLHCGQLGDIEGGIALTQLAFDVIAESGNRIVQCRVRILYNAFIAHWKEHLRNTLEPMLDDYHIALELGDMTVSGYNLYYCCLRQFHVGEELGKISQWFNTYVPQIVQNKQDLVLGWFNIFWQVTLNLMGKTGQTVELLGPVYNEEERLSNTRHINDQVGLFAYHMNKMWLAYLFGKNNLARKHASYVKHQIVSGAGFGIIGILGFYDALIKLNLYHEVDLQTQEQYRRDIRRSQQKIETSAKHAPMNFLHKWHLLEAEQARVLGPQRRADKHYEEAIKLAHENQYLHEQALAYELAGKFYLSLEVPKIAQLYLRDAHYTYQRWGATAKVQQLEEQYPFLAQKFASARAITNDLTTTTMSTSTSTSSRLDIESVLKASQAISGEIHLSKLLDNLMTIVIENAGAEKGCLLLDQNGTYQVAVAAGFAKNTPLPRAIINYVLRSHKNVLLNNTMYEGLFTQDEYIQRHQPKSILCMPLINQGRLTAILYLENNLTTGAFTPDRLEVLNLLSSQAAISIENAVLYNTLEQQVAERTREAEQARLAAEEANQAKSYFLASMSHELRTPLNGILGYAQILKRDSGLLQEQQHGLNIIESSGKHLLMLINDVLDLAKVESGTIDLYQTDFHLPIFLDSVGQLIRIRAKHKGLTFRLLHSESLPLYVRGDERRLRQILLNLLGNAVKFTDHGHVTLDVTVNTTQTSEVLGVILRFEVRDTGIGISEEDIQAIFEPFKQAGQIEQRIKGTGLGLTISRNLIRIMGGQLQVQSTLGEGSHFWFDLPMTLSASPSVDTYKHDQTIVGFSGNTKRVLIVDDNWNNRAVLAGLLTPLGFQAVEAENGRVALAEAIRQPPDLIITDLLMPEMDGFELIKKIHQIASLQHIPIIATSANVYEQDQQKSLTVGSDAFLPKPIEAETLLQLLQHLLPIEWLYQESHLHAKDEEPAPAMILPSVDILKMLLDDAESGDIRALRNRLDKLQQTQPQLNLFISPLQELARSFKMNKIRVLLEEYLEE